MAEPAVILAFLAVTALLLWLIHRLEGALAQTRELKDLVARLTARVSGLEQAGLVAATPQAPVPPNVVTLADAASAPSIGEPLPQLPEDWETLVGANWLNRLGALILVIGVALFIGYSLTQLGPAGKIAIGAVTGISLLGAGIALQPRPAWRIYAYSLMAAGWAILYFTSYAAHGIPAARLIDNPAAATALLLAVSAAMIGHSIRYRSEAATGLACLLGFAGLNVSPLTPFSVVATLILALSVIGVAYRFAWFRLPVLAAALVYLTYAVRPDSGGHGRAALWIYWLAFEAWDLLEARRRGGNGRAAFLVNLTGFVGASLLHNPLMHNPLMYNHPASRGGWFPFLAVVAASYVISAVLRYRIVAPPAKPAAGGYEFAASASALMLAAALLDRFMGTPLTFALLFEAELVVLAGLTLGSRKLEDFGSFLLLAPLGHLVSDAISGERWTPAAAVIGAMLLLNRWLLARGWYFTLAAALVLSCAGWKELPERWAGPVAAIVGAAALRSAPIDIRWTGVLLLSLSWVAAMIANVQTFDSIGTAVVVAALYSGQSPFRVSLSLAATTLLTAFLFHRIPGQLFTVACGMEAASLLTAGFLLSDRTLRLSGLGLFLVCLIRLFLVDLRGLDTGGRILSFVVLGLVLLAASFVYTRFGDRLRRLL